MYEFCNVWVCVCMVLSCVGVLVICVLVLTVFCIVSFMYIYSYLSVLYHQTPADMKVDIYSVLCDVCKEAKERVVTEKECVLCELRDENVGTVNCRASDTA
jgi:hypothetical protein